MKNLISLGKTKTGFLVILFSVIALSSFVSASIPDNNGTIHGCYNNNSGNLKVIDTAIGATCSSRETNITWNQKNTNSQLNLYDTNGQNLGIVIDYNPSPQTEGKVVYNSVLNRVIRIFVENGQTELATPISVTFESSNCTGQPYVDHMSTIKTSLLKWGSSTSLTYGIVNDSVSAQTITAQSSLTSDGNCIAWPPYSASNVFALTTVSLPFNMPIVTPFKF